MNNVAVMQPYFFPYIGYFQLVASVDKFVFFDIAQFNRKSWMSRNRLCNVFSEDIFYIRASIKKPSYTAKLSEVELDSHTNWTNTLIAQLSSYKKSSQFYHETLNFLLSVFSKKEESLSSFNMNSIVALSNYLDLHVEFERYEHELQDDKIGKGEWGLKIAAIHNATHYINAPGGESFIFPEKFTEQNMKLGFIQPTIHEYSQGLKVFHPGLSIIDVLMHNGRERTAEMVHDFNIKWMN